jgi:hypothetical protein
VRWNTLNLRDDLNEDRIIHIFGRLRDQVCTLSREARRNDREQTTFAERIRQYGIVIRVISGIIVIVNAGVAAGVIAVGTPPPLEILKLSVEVGCVIADFPVSVG